MKKLLWPVLFVAVLACGCHHEKESAAPYNRTSTADSYERNFRSNVFASCQYPGKFYANYSLARIVRKPNECDPRYKVTFVNGPCKGKTIYTTDVIEKTAAVGGGQLLKGEVVLYNFWNPRTPNNDIDTLDRWARGVVYDTSNLEKGVVTLEFPHDNNDFMAAREFIYLHNVRYIQKPANKEPRTWLW